MEPATEFSEEIDRALFETAAEIRNPAARLAFLKKTCGGDEAQFNQVMAWLDARDAADAFFRTATLERVEVAAEVAGELGGGQPVRHPAESETSSFDDGPGSSIGRYRLLERIGEGGCGVVYLAEQREPVRRRVALKVIRLGLDTESVIARFEMERQSLALMDHPNIARVFDAGATDSGRPYFVMELVHGVRITEHCDIHRVGLRQRLELFIQVCQAIQHAHQKGIIHRDIKPSNILVSLQDGLAVPKVIDFGIARAVESFNDNDTCFTVCDQFIGTPAYMSPEQADGGHDLDTRSDVYSLGVLLHELLTGRQPFDGKRLTQAGMFEMLRILREEEAPTPSAMLVALGTEELATVAAARSTEPAHLVSAVKGDLNWIVIRAMAKDRRSRYETVNALAMDIRRSLADEPISARAPGRLYLLGKLVRRHKIAFTASVAVALALVAGLAVASWFYLREREARQVQVRLRVMADAARANEGRLLQQSKARETISLAAILLAEGKIEEADALLVKTPLSSIEPSLEAANVFRLLGDWNAIRQRWDQAADCYILFLQANRLDRNAEPPGGLLSLIGIGPTLVQAREFAEYQRFREEVISRYGKLNHPMNAAILIKACLLLPADEVILTKLKPATELAAAAIPKDLQKDSGLGAYQNAFAAMSLGLMEYRRGNFAAAMEWNRRCQAFPDTNQARSATAHMVSAMAAHRLGQTALAHTEITLGRAIFAGPFANDAKPRGEWQGIWQDWAIARVLEREAAALIGEAGSQR